MSARIALPVLATDAVRGDELERAGWTRRFAAAPPRLDEMIELYRSLGLEVRLEPVDPATLDADCAGCFAAAAATRIIYTRGLP
ncbi:MAG TPA: hypothetical protein VFZ24_18180 [Longimicrobiales bacterium]